MSMDAAKGFEAIDRAGNVKRNLMRHKGAMRCSYTDGPETYDHNVMLPNGDVHLCCMDYGLSTRLGNLFEQSWDEIQNDEPMRALREANAIEGDSLCRRCHGAKGIGE
jgi:radical SAM protein with 4Fe4S-binding SPASM domain